MARVLYGFQRGRTGERMIYTDINHVKQYLGIHKNLDTAIDYILTHRLDELKNGSNAIDEELVFANRFCYMTLPETETIFESHLIYADIHLLLKGHEKIGVTSVEDLTVTRKELKEDQVDCYGNVAVYFPLRHDKILILFPGEAHMVKIMDQTRTQVEKVVIKVKMEGTDK